MRKSVKVKVFNGSPFKLPVYKKFGDSGMDVQANVFSLNGGFPVILKPYKRMIVPTGFFIEIPDGYEIQVRPRSGLAINHGITVLNTPGTIDSGYRNEIGVIVVNLSDKDFIIEQGMNIAQIVLQEVPEIMWSEVERREDLSVSDRGNGGFGSTGK